MLPPALKAMISLTSKAVVLGLICLLSIEAAGALLFFEEEGSLVYRRSAVADHVDELDTSGITTPREAVATFSARLHPYFGFAGRYDGELGGLHWNAIGSLQRTPITIPYAPAANEIVVVLFGGSVAQSLAVM